MVQKINAMNKKLDFSIVDTSTLLRMFLYMKKLKLVHQLRNCKVPVLQSANHADCNETPLTDLSQLHPL